jgi:DNA-binding SARP family transcriptional activator
LDPARPRHAESRFFRSRQGGYLFDTSVAWVDVDEFEREARAGLAALKKGDGAAARPHLARASCLYKGMFMADDPYAEWAFVEREQLHELAILVLRGRAESSSTAVELEAATDSAKRLADIEPYDEEVQRLLLGLVLKNGRRGEAIRRFESYRRRVEKDFGVKPDFDLRTLEA